MRYLLDTNIVSDLIRCPQGRIARRIAEVGEESVCTSIIVAADGGAQKRSMRLSAQVEAVLGPLNVIALETPADVTYGEIRATLERTGQVIGANDLLIAAQAVALGLTLVTDNEREFSRVGGLAIENWLCGK